jgi:hypothetical protein
MPDITSIQVSLVNPNLFFESHSATFAEPSASQIYAIPVFGITPDVARVQINELTILITDLITDLDRGYKTLQPIPVKIVKSGDSYIASFEEANIHASGETWAQAARHLKSLIVDIYDSLVSETAPLSRPSKSQLDTLLRYVHAE